MHETAAAHPVQLHFFSFVLHKNKYEKVCLANWGIKKKIICQQREDLKVVQFFNWLSNQIECLSSVGIRMYETSCVDSSAPAEKPH